MTPAKTSDQEPGLTGLMKADHSVLQRCEMLDRTQWANELSWSQVETFAAYMDSYQVKQDQLILHEGERDAHMILIVQGQVNIIKQDSAQVQKVITTLGPGKTFGEMSLIDGEPRSASAVAATDVTLLVLTKENFLLITKEVPHLGITFILRIAKLMSQRLRQTSGQLIDYLKP